MEKGKSYKDPNIERCCFFLEMSLNITFDRRCRIWNLLFTSQDFPDVSHLENYIASDKVCKAWLRFALMGQEMDIPHKQKIKINQNQRFIFSNKNNFLLKLADCQI